MASIIEGKNISLIYGEGKLNQVKALDNVDVSINKGEYVAFFGPSGCGKSSLLYVLAGLKKPTSGEVVVDDKDLFAFNANQLAAYRRNTLGFIFQSFNLVPTLNVLHNVALPWLFQGKPRKERRAKAQELLDRFGLGNLSQRLIHELSGGQQQRVAVARAMINDAPIILADEPVGNLDSKNSVQIMDVLRTLNEKDKKTVILITHDPAHLKFADRILYMKDGTIVREVVNTRKIRSSIESLDVRPLKSVIESLANLYPNLSESQLQAKALTLHLLSTYNYEEIERSEELLEDILNGDIDFKKFQEELDKPFMMGGVGLYSTTAGILSTRVETVFSLSNNIKRLELEPEMSDRVITEIVQYLISAYQGEISPEQLKRLRKGIEQRLSDELTPETCLEFMDRSLKKGGVGLNERSARKFSRLLEIIMIPYYVAVEK